MSWEYTRDHVVETSTHNELKSSSINQKTSTLSLNALWSVTIANARDLTLTGAFGQSYRNVWDPNVQSDGFSGDPFLKKFRERRGTQLR